MSAADTAGSIGSAASTPPPNARLEALAGMTQEADAANPSAEQQQQAAAQQAQASQADAAAKQWGMLMYTIGGFAQMIAPELKPVYSEERCFSWGQQANAVAEKYGFNGTSAMPELALIASTAGFFVPTWLMIKQRLSQAKAVKDGTLVEKLAAWWQHRKATRAAQQQQQQAQASGEGQP